MGIFQKKTTRTAGKHLRQNVMLFGKGLSFAAAEAYKLLRTNLVFSLAGGQNCRIVGITSSQPGEGKSTMAANLAYMLAEAGRRVLLIDGDMRQPSIARQMNISAAPGLSNLLVGLSRLDEVVRDSGVSDHLRVIPAGEVPPNPSELLGSPRMQTALSELSRDFEFIILDLPPAAVVADALVISKLVDGMVVVVRQNYTHRRALDETMRQLKHADARVLGFVVTDSDEAGGARYGKRGKFRHGSMSGKKA